MKIVGATVVAFFGVVSVASAGDIYGYEKTNEWFSVSASSAGATITDGNGWTAPVGGEAGYNSTSGKIEFDAEVTAPLKYTPAASPASGPVALVNVRLVVDPNATTPSLEGLDGAQAALTVVTNTTSGGGLEWVGLAKVSGTAQWVALSGEAPTAGDEYDVEIALDNGTAKVIRYSVKGTGDDSYTPLTYGGDAWLANPQSTDHVTSVAFAGAGKVGDFSGVSIQNDGVIVALGPDKAGYDFTNGTVKAVVTIPQDNASSAERTAVLSVVKFDGTTQTYDPVPVTPGQTNEWDLSNLTTGGTYSYTVTVRSGGSERAVKSGTFTAANWNDGYWFSATNNVVDNGSFVAGASFADGKWDVSGDANFTVTDIAPGSNAVSRVDTRYSFESFVDAESLERLDDAVGGIVAVDGGSWYAYTGNGATEGWAALTGGIAAAAGVEYVIRAEFDFLSATHRVRYLVSEDGTTFVPLKLGGNEWISLASQVPGSLSSVGMSGKGYVKAISAKVSDKAVAESDGVKYNTLWEALRNGNGTVTLLTNATLRPSEISGGKFGPYTIIVGGYGFVFDKSQLTGKWQFVQKDGQWYLMKPGATYIFF